MFRPGDAAAGQHGDGRRGGERVPRAAAAGPRAGRAHARPQLPHRLPRLRPARAQVHQVYIFFITYGR